MTVAAVAPALARIPIWGLDGLPLPDTAPAAPTVYGLLVRHGITGKVGVGYVGKTVQRLRARVEQHQVEQPFGDVIVGAFVIEQHPGWDDVRLSMRETYHIRVQRPWHNITDNMGNPDRILPWDAVKQRQAREPGWQPPPKGERAALGFGSRMRRIRWAPRRIRAALWSGLWLTIALSSGVWLTIQTDVPALLCLLIGAGAASVLVGISMPRRRRRARRRR